MAFARRTQQIGAPDKHIARKVKRVVGIFAGHLQLAAFERFDDIVNRVLFGFFRIPNHLQRVGLQLRCGRQPAHAFGADVKIDQTALPVFGLCQRRQNLMNFELFITPLAGVAVEKRSAVHLPWRALPIQAERQRQPAGLRTQFFLPDIMRPAAAGLPDATAQHQHIHDAAIIHVHVVPVIDTGAQDHHRAALGFFGVGRKFPRHRDHVFP